MNDDNWSNLHKKYSEKDWSKIPSIFATEAIDYFPPGGLLLELGTGVGQDGIFFADKGYDVTATDLFIDTVNETIEGASKKTRNKINTQIIDLRQPLDFSDSSFDIVYAHLSLHYFDQQTTERIFNDIFRILKKNGVFAFFTNSTSDPEYATGTKIEDDYYMIDNIAKRYFSLDSTKSYLERFSIILLDDKGETYKDKAVGVHNLIRAVVTKS